MAQQTLNTPRETTHQRIADALEDMVDKIVDTSSAGNIDYDNTESGLDATKVQGAVDELASEKVNKVQGKGLSTNDYTDTEKQKLAGIEAEANKTVVDSAINDRSTNPLQNRVITAALDEKTDVNNFNALTQEFELFNTYDLSNDVEISVFANKTYKKDKYDDSHVPNLDGEYSVSLGDKTFTETCTFTIANEGKSITETFHTNSKYILGAKLLKAENDEVGESHVIADVVTLLISKDAPYTTTFDPTFENPPATGVLTLKVSVKPDEKYVNKENTGGPAEYAYWGSYNGSDLLINNPILTYSETTFGQPKVSGNPITINDAAEANAVDVSVDIEPVQDLHGYDAPWVGGAGKNKLPVTEAEMKRSNTSGTWNNNAYTINGLTFTIKTDESNNIIGINVNGTANNDTTFTVYDETLNLGAEGSYTMSGCPLNGSTSTYRLSVFRPNSVSVNDVGNGIAYSYDEPIRHYVFITIISGTTLNNLLFQPMIESGNTKTSYTPYSNICPIIGWDEVNVGVNGVNVWDEEWELGDLDSQGNPTPSSTLIRSKNFISVVSSITYYFKSNVIGYFAQYDANKIIIGNKFNVYAGTAFTTASNARYIKFILDGAYGTTYNHDISINYPSTDTEYHAYNGHTYTIDLDGTRYGGTLDVTTGVLTVDKIGANIAIESIYNRPGNDSVSFGVFSLPYAWSNPVDIMCEKGFYLGNFSTTTYGAIAVYSTNNRQMAISCPRDYTVEECQAFFGDCMVVYELATPLTIQLTPQQIRLLKGTNNLSCNTGNLTIKYYPDNVLGQLKGDIEKGLNAYYDYQIQALWDKINELQA